MSINFEKNRDKIVAAWSDVIDDKTETNWALYGYEGQTNDLKVVGTGDGGLEELADDLNSGKIMYAFVRVEDPKSSLTKFVLINWQGEGAPTVRKATCANHIRDVQNILKGAHLTINARLEDEVETELILKKVSGVGSAFSFKDHKHTTGNADVQKVPVGTVYSRVNPTKEINAMDRDNFWKKEEEEEKRRVDLERERKKQELVKVEEERRAREQKEYTERERRNIENLSKSSNELNSPVKSPIAQLSPTLVSPEPEVSRGMTQAELMRQQRNQEAKELIGGRVGAAKAIFSQNSASGQMQTVRGSAPAKPARNSIAQRINTLNNQGQQQSGDLESPKTEEVPTPTIESPTEIISPVSPVHVTYQEPEHQNGRNHTYVAEPQPIVAQDDDGFDDPQTEEPQYSTIKRSPHTKTVNSQAATPIEENQIVVGSDKRVIDLHRNNEVQLINEDGLLMDDMMGDPGLRARALYDYQAADESEITFDPGDIITHIDQIDEGWWQGLGPDGTYGLFPANYVELFKD